MAKQQWKPGESGNPAGRPKGSTTAQIVLTREIIQAICVLGHRAAEGDLEATSLLLEKGLPVAAHANRLADIEGRIGILEQATKAQND